MLVKLAFRLRAMLIVATLTVCSVSTAGSHELKQTVTAEHLSAAVWIFPVSTSDYEIYVTFRSSEPAIHPAGCISVYRDFQYTLIDANGRLVPIDQAILAHPPFEHPLISLSSSDIGRPYDCRRSGVQQSDARTFLSKLYPKLAPGNYTLRVMFAPRGLTSHVPLTSMAITISTKIAP